MNDHYLSCSRLIVNIKNKHIFFHLSSAKDQAWPQGEVLWDLTPWDFQVYFILYKIVKCKYS